MTVAQVAQGHLSDAEIIALVGRHSYDSPRKFLQTSTSVSTILSTYPCNSEVAGKCGLDLYYGKKAGVHRLEREDGATCCGGGGNWGHEWNCWLIKLRNKVGL